MNALQDFAQLAAHGGDANTRSDSRRELERLAGGSPGNIASGGYDAA